MRLESRQDLAQARGPTEGAVGRRGAPQGGRRPRRQWEASQETLGGAHGASREHEEASKERWGAPSEQRGNDFGAAGTRESRLVGP